MNEQEINQEIERRTLARRHWDERRKNDKNRCEYCDFTGMVLALDKDQNSYAFLCGGCEVARDLGLSLSIPLWQDQKGFVREKYRAPKG